MRLVGISGLILVMAVCGLSFAAGGVAAGETPPPMPILQREDYRQDLVALARMLEEGSVRSASEQINQMSARPKDLPEKYVENLCEERRWSKKNLMYCGFAAHRVYVPAVHDVYVLVLTDRGSGLWVFRVYKGSASSPKWYLQSLRYEKDVSVLGTDQNPPQIVTGSGNPQVRVELKEVPKTEDAKQP